VGLFFRRSLLRGKEEEMEALPFLAKTQIKLVPGPVNGILYRTHNFLVEGLALFKMRSGAEVACFEGEEVKREGGEEAKRKGVTVQPQWFAG